MNNYDPGILCFQHDRNEAKVFCLEFPSFCQFCNCDLLNTELLIPPFRIPYPFKDASNECNAVVIKPTIGDFLNNYENSSDLHIGVTDSKGVEIRLFKYGCRKIISTFYESIYIAPERVKTNRRVIRKRIDADTKAMMSKFAPLHLSLEHIRLADFINKHTEGTSKNIFNASHNGFVVEYDAHGLRRAKSQNWGQCLSIKVLPHLTSIVQSYWDDVLLKTFLGNSWTSDRYDTESYNCYTFVLTFLRTLQLEELKPYIFDKVSFCKQFVAPQTHIAAKYISLYRQLKRNIKNN